MNKTLRTFAMFASVAVLATPAFAEGVLPEATVSAGISASAGIDADSSLSVRVKARAYEEIERRMEALEALKARIGAMKKASAAAKTGLIADVNAQIRFLGGLKAKIAADASMEALRADVRSVVGTHGTYALVVTKGHIMAAAERELAIIELMTKYRSKLSAAIDLAISEGKDADLMEASLSDFDAKLASAKVQANAALSAVAYLASDNGDQEVFDSNREALKSGRSKVKAASADLKAAWEDAKTIIAKAKSMRLYIGAAATTSATATSER